MAWLVFIQLPTVPLEPKTLERLVSPCGRSVTAVAPRMGPRIVPRPPRKTMTPRLSARAKENSSKVTMPTNIA